MSEIPSIVRTSNGKYVDRSRRTIIMADEWNSMSDRVKSWYVRGVLSVGMEKQVWVYTEVDLINREDKAYVIQEDPTTFVFYEHSPHSIESDVFFEFDESDWIFNQ